LFDDRRHTFDIASIFKKCFNIRNEEAKTRSLKSRGIERSRRSHAYTWRS